MRPKKHATTGSGDLFRARLDAIINMKHELVQLAGKLDGEIAPLYSDKGRPGVETRFVIGLLLLKHIFALSDRSGMRALGLRPLFPVLHRGGVLPACVPTRALGPQPLARAPRREARTAAGRELAGGA
jgi:hypothetical protein